jgi:hypothetical protein
MMEKEATYKGLIALGSLDFVRANYGMEGLEKFLQQFSAEDQRFLTHFLIPVSKVPASMLHKFYAHFLTLWGEGQGDYYSTVMRHVAKYSLSSSMQFFIKIGKPSFIARNAGMVWKHFFSTGSLICTGSTDHSVELSATGGEEYGPALCYGIIGFGTTALELSGARNIRVNHDECIHKKKSSCIFRVAWE